MKLVQAQALLIIAMLNPKGGSGKSASLHNIAAALMLRGLAVLLVDLDVQGSLTSATSGDLVTAGGGVGSLLLGEATTAPPAIRTLATCLDGHLDLLPADEALERWSVACIRGERSTLDAGGALAPLAARYQVVLIDTPGATGPALEAGLLAAQIAAVAVRPGSQYDLDPLERLFAARAALRRRCLWPTPIGYLIPTDYRAGEASQRAGLAALQQTYGGMVTRPIPHSALVERAINAGTCAVLASPRSAVAAAYRAVADQLRASSTGSR